MSTTATIPNADTITSPAQGTPTPTGIPYADAPPQSAPPPQQPAADTKPDTSSWDHAAQNPGDVTDLKAPAPDPVHTITTNKPGGIIGVMQSVMDSLVGKTTPEIATDNDGNKYVHQVDATGQQQWKRLAGEVISGAAAGLAAGQGAGNMGKAPLAGVQAAEQQQQQRQKQWDAMSAEARQENMDRANRVMQNMQIAKTSWELSNAQHKAGEDTVKFSNDEVDRYQKMGGQVLGVAKDYSDIAHILKQDPDAVHNMIVKGDIVTVPAFDDKGDRAGTTFVKLPNGWAKQMLPSGTEFKAWNGQTHQLETRRASDGMTTGEQELLNNSAVLQQQQWQQQTVTQQQVAQAAKDKSALNTSEITKNVAMANKDNAEATHARAESQMLNSASTQSEIQSNAQQLVEGTADPSNLSKRAKSYDATLAAANAISLQKFGVPFDLAKAAGDYKFATNPQTVNTLTYLNSLVGHDNTGGNLGQLVRMSDALKQTQFPALNNIAQWTKLQNGNPQVAAYRAALLETSDQVAKILQGGGTGSATSDAKLKQASEIFDKGFNGAQVRAVATDTLRPLLGNRKAELIGSNRYLQRWNQTAQQSTGQPNPNAPPPPPAVGTVKDGYRFKGGNPADHASWEPVPPTAPAGR